jgi:hypothetical protein
MSHTVSHDDRKRRGREAIDRIADGFKELYAIWLEIQSEAQAVETSRRSAAEASPASSDDLELLTTKELARRISYSKRQIQTFKLEGMPFTGKGRGTRFKLHEVIAWLDQRQRTNHENNRVSIAGNGKVPQAPIKTRLQASQRR